MPGNIGEDQVTDKGNNNWSYGQSIQPIRQVYGIGETYDDEDGEQDVPQSKIRSNIL